MASEPKQASGKKRRTDERTARQRIKIGSFGFSYTTRVTVTFSLVVIMTVGWQWVFFSYVWEANIPGLYCENASSSPIPPPSTLAGTATSEETCNA